MKYLTSIIIFLFSLSVLATPPLAKLEAIGGNKQIVFSNFADLGPFEKYECKIDFGSWVYSLNATAYSVNGETWYRCVDQGYLTSGQTYNVWFVYQDWPSDYRSQSPVFKLNTTFN